MGDASRSPFTGKHEGKRKFWRLWGTKDGNFEWTFRNYEGILE
jgi:hypothetical protein